MVNFQKALHDPASFFSSPEAVLEDQDLSKEQKIKILKQWEYDARELEVADEENMAGSSADVLDLVLNALNTLDPGHPHRRGSTTKHGGSWDD